MQTRGTSSSRAPDMRPNRIESSTMRGTALCLCAAMIWTIAGCSGETDSELREPETVPRIVSAPLPPGLRQVWWNQTGLLLTADEDTWVERLDRVCRASIELQEKPIVRDHDAAMALADEFIVADGLRPDLDAEYREHVHIAAVTALWLMVTHPGVCWDKAPPEFLEAGWRHRPEPSRLDFDEVQLMTDEAQAQVTARLEQQSRPE